MSTTEQRLTANRLNAPNSTGPVTVEGKSIACKNSIRHGLLSSKLLLDDEDPVAFQSMQDGLCGSLNPFGAAEAAIVERIAVTLWRQRRLVHAETANLSLARQPKKIAGGVSAELGRGSGSEPKLDELAPFDVECERWCREALAEIDALGEVAVDIAALEHRAPLVFAQLKSDADDEGGIAAFVKQHDGGLTGYLGQLLLWCREQLRNAEARPRVLALAEQVRDKKLVLPTDTLELLARYQTSLDNQLFKLLRALREAQEWRLKTLEASPAQAVVMEGIAEAA